MRMHPLNLQMPPYPEANELMDDIYWETDNPDKKTSQGTMFFETPPQ